MNIVEEVDRRRQTLKIRDPSRAYAELKDLLENRIALDGAHEEKYFNDLEKNQIRARINCEEGFDAHTAAKYEIYLTIDEKKSELDMQVKAKLVTEYPTEKAWQGTLWYYAYRSLFDKFLYGSVRHGFEHAAEEKLDTIMERVRETLETSSL
ncbi:hypothetical protein [Candidatus Nanohalobium constans]|uniref:Uncharacterized protein n=1 Tax=Candidatus Nanohalobium constans TaxID=2565781 RepID=A0A5Q0UEK0_9ARCH|nr:hypothetical protein [Candidatus Nanohalobium constans]QGA79914.1 hypothetical protein LC1Nh_0005 [Candidatus Nanohalobium constans]